MSKKDQKKYITEEKKQELEDELDYLMNTRREEIAKEIERAKSMGDLSENAEYQQAREDQANAEGRIVEIKNILKSAEIVNHKKSDTVEVGSTVAVRKKYSSTDQSFQIVGSEETNLAEGRVSHTAPLGEALLGHKAGDTVEVKTPGGEVVYHIESVE
ncbi:MAG: transcription elongation factor GreA [Candidatus Paceibacterota bacterium]